MFIPNFSWETSESLLLANPSYSQTDYKRFHSILKVTQAWPGHVWLSTSGSSVQKWVGLSKQALLASAAAVNAHLDSNPEDRWIHMLPDFHVGGVGIWARAHLSGARVFDFKKMCPKWHAERFYGYTQHMQGTLASLVPAQLYDLVALGWEAPASLRAVIIGGGALIPVLYERAIALGWPLLPSYGLTECGSQVATAALDSWKKNQLPEIQLLSHLKGKECGDHLCFSGSSLMSTYAYLDHTDVQFIDPKIEGWLTTEDRGTIQNGCVKVVGRVDEIIKIGGENVDLASLERLLQLLRLQLALTAEVTLIAFPDSRLDFCIHLASNSPDKESLYSLIQHFQQRVLPFERIRKIYLLPHLPRSSLGKILKEELKVSVTLFTPLDP